MIRNKTVDRGDGTTELHIQRKSGERVIALLDTADVPVLHRYPSWGVVTAASNKHYVSATEPRCGRINQIRVVLHRVILGDEIPDGHEVGFRNGNGYDCRRANLFTGLHREVAQAQNRKCTRSATGHRCILRHPDRRGFVADLSVQGRNYCRYFLKRRDAVRWRDEVLRMYGYRVDEQGRRLLIAA